MIMFQSLSSFICLFTVLQLTFADGRSGSGLSATKCIGACKYDYLKGNPRVCAECSVNPPITYLMCYFACSPGTNWINPDNAKSLARICDKCFANIHIMETVCRNNCDQLVHPYEEIAVLCQICDTYGI